MKKFTYQYSDLQNDVLTNSDRTNLKMGSDGLGYFVPPDERLEDAIVPEITYTATNATAVDKTVKAWTYYCDSLSGCVEGTEHYSDGDGSKEKPWRSMTYALVQIEQMLTCWRNATCCYDPYRKGKYFQLKVKGIIDYTVNFLGYGNGVSYYNYLHGAEKVNNEWVQQFIISPWENSSWTVFTITYVYGTILNWMNFEIRPISQNRPSFHAGSNSILNHVDLATATFTFCENAKFIDLTATHSEYNEHQYGDEADLFYSCNGSDIIGFTGRNFWLKGCTGMNIYNATVTNNDNSNQYFKIINGFTK